MLCRRRGCGGWPEVGPLMTGPSLGHVCFLSWRCLRRFSAASARECTCFFWCCVVLFLEYNHTQGKRVGIGLGLDACVCAFLCFLVHVIWMLSVAVVCWTVWRGDMHAFFVDYAFYFSILGGKGTSYLPSRGRYWLGVAEGCSPWCYTVS